MNRQQHFFLGLLFLFAIAFHAQTPPQVRIQKASEEKASGGEVHIESSFESKDHLDIDLPEIKREFRAAWVATVANINWPSSRNLSTEDQKAEALFLLDLLKSAHFNAVVFQVRPSADALYESCYEPWSYFLCGETGKYPSPYYDPLQFWIEEAHNRGMELHVWLNPYRVHHLSGGAVHGESMVYKSSDHIVRLKNGMYWFDPASQKTQNHVSNVVRDIVSRYDIDAVHFDDYFYPYASYNRGEDFPDHESWSQYQKSGGKLSRSDWRRSQVNQFIERIHQEIKEEKPYVKFGISPFGIWKSGYPEGVVGTSQYDELYADAKLWLNKGWVDYFAPQLYWPVDAPKQNFKDLLEWWKEQNTQNRHLWPGLNTVEVRSSNRPQEIVNQLEITREVLDKNQIGALHYSVAGLTNSPKMVAALKSGPYKEQALVPKTPWIAVEQMAAPLFEIIDEGEAVRAYWSERKGSRASQWVLFLNYGDQWEVQILTKDMTFMHLPKMKKGKKLHAIALKAIDRLGNESDYIATRLLD